jgi:hypothetical protein
MQILLAESGSIKGSPHWDKPAMKLRTTADTDGQIKKKRSGRPSVKTSAILSAITETSNRTIHTNVWHAREAVVMHCLHAQCSSEKNKDSCLSCR